MENKTSFFGKQRYFQGSKYLTMCHPKVFSIKQQVSWEKKKSTAIYLYGHSAFLSSSTKGANMAYIEMFLAN